MCFKDTYAFLIGVQKYNDKSFPALPQSFKNVNELQDILTGEIVGLPIENVTLAIDPENSVKLVTDMQEVLSKDNLNTLLIYYAGHGVVDENGNHFLTITTSTRSNIKINGLNVSYISEIFKEARNKKIIFILDSCFSERAFGEFESRNYLLIASSEMNNPSFYPLGARCSAFTGELINVFNEGINNNSKTITWREVYQQLKLNLTRAKYPIPKISSTNEMEDIIAGKNCYTPPRIDDFILDKKWCDLIFQIARNNAGLSKEVNLIFDGGGSDMTKQLKGKLLDNLPFLIAYNLEKICRNEVVPEDYYNLYDKSVQFLYFVFFMQLEHFKSKEEISSIKDINEFKSDFKKPPVQCITFDHLKRLCEDLLKCGQKLFITEIDFNDSDFQNSAIEIENIKQSDSPDLVNLRANMMTFLIKIGCLVNYKLVSVREIRLKFPKYKEKLFSHSVSLLEGKNPTAYEYKDEKISSIFINQTEATNSHSVLLIKTLVERPIDYINLWPLIIDANSILLEGYPSIYYYVGKDENSNSLLYKPVKSEEGDKLIAIIELDRQAYTKPFEDLIE